MKQQFLKLVKDVKKTRIVKALSKATTIEELERVWKKFSEENTELFAKINDWAEEFISSETKQIFKDYEEISNPIETAIVIYIIDDCIFVSEVSIFEDWTKIPQEIEQINSDFAKKVAELVASDYICNIKAKDFFPEKVE